MNNEGIAIGAGQSKETHSWLMAIKNQVCKNYLCNIFNDKINLEIQDLERLNLEGITENQIRVFSKYSADLLSSCLYKDNQYIYFDHKALKDLEKIYQYFFNELLNGKNRQGAIKSHHVNIKKFLIRTNPFLELINSNDDEKVKTYLCCEYGGDFQLCLLNIKPQDISGPVLDIGCGEHANLVRFLNNQGIIAIGIDRKTTRQENSIECDWFDFDFIENKYGTIISNNAFSIHFINAISKNQNISGYTQLFFKILKSLKESGCFYCAPSIPFIEKYVNTEEYIVSYHRIYHNIYGTKIKRI